MIEKAGIVDYGVGNVGNVLRALDRIGLEGVILKDPDKIDDISTLILPGVGAFPKAMKNLIDSGWKERLTSWAEEGKNLIGICLGMQLLCQKSLEHQEVDGLGLIDGMVVPLEIKPLPHMGWNDLYSVKETDPVIRKYKGSYFYFVHSYGLLTSKDETSRTEAGGISFVSSVRSGSVVGFQFHPERSGPTGLRLLGDSIKENSI